MRKLLLLLVIVPTIAFGQVTLEEGLKKEIVIEGNVSDVNGMPLTGVAILVKGISNLIKTNFDGNFNLKADEGAVLIISCSGFKTKEITVGNQIKMNITLEDEVKSKTIRTLTKSDIRKKRRADNKSRRDAQRGKNVEDLDDWLLKSAGRSVKGAIRKNRNN
jgi:hypothetical protein